MKKPRIKVVLASILSIAMLAAIGCSPTNETTETEGGGSETTTDGEATGETSSGEAVEIIFTEWDGGDTLAVYEDIAQAFNESQSNVKVTVQNIPAEYDTKITTMIAGNTAPEVAMMNSDTLLFPLAEEGKILNLQEYIDNDPDFDTSAIGDQFKYMLTSDYMAGYGIGSENITLFYNPALFTEYGVEEPPTTYAGAWDWETFVDNAKTLTIDGSGRNAHDAEFDPDDIDIYGVTFSKWWASYMPFMYSMGMQYLTEDGSSIGYATEEGLTVLQNLADLIHVHHVSPKPTVSETMPGLSETLATGKVAMNIGGQWSNATLMADEVEYNVAALPKMGDEAKTVATFGAVTLMDTPNAEAGFEFIKYLLTEVGAAEPLFKSGLWLPTNMNEFKEDYISTMITPQHPTNYYDAIVLPQIDGTAMSPVPQYVKNFAKIDDIITPSLDDLWSGEKTAEEAVDAIVDEANDEVQGFYGD